MDDLAPPYSVRPTEGSSSPPDPPGGRTAAADRRTLAPRASATTPGYKTALGLAHWRTLASRRVIQQRLLGHILALLMADQ